MIDPEENAVRNGYELNRLAAVLLIVWAVKDGSPVFVYGLALVALSYGAAYIGETFRANGMGTMPFVIVTIASTVGAYISWLIGALA